MDVIDDAPLFSPLRAGAVYAARGWAALALLAFLLLGAMAPRALAGYSTVVLDAGHGGHDRGGIPTNFASEKVATLAVAQRVQKILRDSGLRVVMTRSGDYFVRLDDRVNISNAQRNAVFVSIHFNSGQREGAQGIETYYYSPRALPLARTIHANVVAAAGTPDRRIRQRGYYVLRKNRLPAVLVECGFLTNRAEARRAQTAVHQQRLAYAIASAIVRMSRR